MENKNEDKKPDVKIINTSFIDYLGDLYEQVYDKDTGETFFIKYNKFIKLIHFLINPTSKECLDNINNFVIDIFTLITL